MKHKSLKATILTTALALSMTSLAIAAPTPGGAAGSDKPGDEYYENKDTTISIFTSSSNVGSVSYTVPLYVTMAVSNGSANVAVPTNYSLTNTTSLKEGEDKDHVGIIGVTDITFEKLKDAHADAANNFYTVAAPPADTGEADEICLKIAGETMPTIDKNASGGALVKTFKPQGTILVTGGKPTMIKAGQEFTLDIDGKVAKSAPRTDKATAAQFRIKYTISPLNGSGQSFGSVYAGSDRGAAGLSTWGTTPQ